MRVLDIGSGPGDVSFVAARLVGPTGTVLGVDAGPAMVEFARARAAEQGLSTVHFTQATVSEIDLDEPVDAVVGRLILMHLPDPVATLRHLSSFVRPGGVIAFSENDMNGTSSIPAMPLFGQVSAGIIRAFEAMGLSARFGTTLHRVFADAGLGAPHLTVGTPIGTAADTDILAYAAEVWRLVSPVAEQGGFAIDEVEIRRVRAEIPRRGARGQRPHHDAPDDHGMGPGAPVIQCPVSNQYSTGLSRRNIEQALLAAGKDLDHLQPADLGMLEDFHTMGRFATAQLADLVGLTSDNAVLDAGSGIGGTARYVADRYGCTVTAVDLTDEYCETHRWLNELVGLDKRIAVRQADVTALPFADASFTVVISQHVQMNVADKARLYPRRAGCWQRMGGLPCGTSRLAAAVSSTIRCHGPMSPHAVIWPTLMTCARRSSPPGSPSSTGMTSPSRRPH